MKQAFGEGRATASGLVSTGFLVIFFVSISLSLAQPADANDETHTHFRFGHITWEQIGSPFITRITYTAGFRRGGFSCRDPISGQSLACSEPDGRPGLGDSFLETVGATRINDFGDGSSTGTLYFKVFAFSAEDDWVLARALEPGTEQGFLSHEYPDAGPFTLVSASCCRVSGLRAPNAHINNPDAAYRVETTVDFRTTASPISLLPPIVDCPAESTCRFSVTSIDPDAVDPESPRLQVRLATPTEMGGSGLTQPPGAEIRDLPGNIFQYRWDTRGANRGPEGFQTLYSTQVVIEDLDASGNPISKSVLDFFIRIVELPGPPEGLIMIPTRWCGLGGSPSMDDPGLVSSTSTDQVLIRRHIRANFRIYYDQSNMIFISGARTGGFPIFEGPSPEPGGENIGNIPDPLTISALSIRRAWNDCRLAWQDKDPAVTGLIALNVNRFVGADRTPVTNILGYAGLPAPNDLGQQLLNGKASVIDRAYLVEDPDPDLPPPPPLAPDDDEKWLAHELGHALSLIHVIDGVNLLDNQRVRAITLTENQVARIRTQADRFIPDRVTNPTLPALGSTWADVLDDTPSDETFVDIDTVGIGVDQNEDTTHLVASTLGLLPVDISGLNYFFAVDTDNDPGTGGAPSEVGVPDNAQGIELVARLQVDASDGIVEVIPTVWKFQNGAFVEITDPSIEGRVEVLEIVPIFSTPLELEPDVVPAGQIIQVILSNAIRGPIAADVRSVVVSESTVTATVDRVEALIILTPATFPRCQVNPPGALLGSSVTVTANGLPANSPVDVFLGTEVLVKGTTDNDGNLSLDLTVPLDGPTGAHPVSVHAVETAITADCAINLLATPVFDVPPTPPSGSTFTVGAGGTLSFSVQASDADAGDLVTLGVIGLPAGAAFPIPAPSNPATATFSWTPTADQIGGHVIVFSATDSTGLSATPHSVGVEVQGISIEIDIKPGGVTNPVNPKSNGKIPVAILSTPDFEAAFLIDKESLTFGRTGDEESLHRRGKAVPNCDTEDVNDDGMFDLVCHFNTQDTGFQSDDAEGILRGLTIEGVPIEGRDSVEIAP